jgi:uridylate kinase
MNSTILSLGGSLIIPDQVNTTFLQSFRSLILSQLNQHQFVIFTGGGKPAREYQSGLAALLDDASAEDLDWIGIHASRLNAHLVRLMFADQAAEEIIIDPTQQYSMDTPIRIGAGWKPGWSTDYDAVAFAVGHGIKRVVNLSNISMVYDKDPHQFPDATPIADMTWADFRTLVGDTWTPGLNSPFDPIAAKLAQEHDIEVIIANGSEIDNTRAIIIGDTFVGTKIHS